MGELEGGRETKGEGEGKRIRKREKQTRIQGKYFSIMDRTGLVCYLSYHGRSGILKMTKIPKQNNIRNLEH